MHRLAKGDAERGRLRVSVITEYMPFARHLASRYGVRSQSVEDLRQTAYVGLVKAVDNFDPDRGTAFPAFAAATILGELKRHFRDTTWVLHVPRRIKDLSCELRAASESLSHSLMRAPTVDELAVALGAGAAEVTQAIMAAEPHALTSLDSTLAAEMGGGGPLGEQLGFEDLGFRDVLERETLRPLLAILSRREKWILLMRFFGSMTQAEIAAEIGVSQMQVSRLLRGILGKLRTQAGCDVG
jgi:RNA polymerase sigma-B factor